MKSQFLLPAVLLSLSSIALAQMDAQKPMPQSDAQKSFDQIKALAGAWEGQVKMDPPMNGESNANLRVTMRITSRGNALVHEMQGAGKADDPMKDDHPVTMFYVDGDRLNLVHYCDAGNRPHMAARISPDGKKLEFDFVDLSGGDNYGHMYHALFTFVDANHHLEDWTYMMPGDKPMYAHMDLQRAR